jgi:hypothetical protein
MQAWSKSVPGGWVFRANCRIRFSFLVPIKEHIEEWNKLNADPGTRNAEHKIDFLIAWTIDERKDGVAAFCPYVSQCQKEEMCIGQKLTIGRRTKDWPKRKSNLLSRAAAAFARASNSASSIPSPVPQPLLHRTQINIAHRCLAANVARNL